MRIAITGASGLVGSALVQSLQNRGHEALRLVRRPARDAGEVEWSAENGPADPNRLESLDAVVHLAGENIAARRWNAAQKERIRSSRVAGTRRLVGALADLASPPKTFLCASAVGFYGDRGGEILTEDSSRGEGFLADTCVAWEREASEASSFARTVFARFGVILSPDGGALAKMLLPFKLGAGGRIGSGEQFMSWIALDDAVGALVHALENDAVRGPMNVVARPVTIVEYTKTLGRVLGRPTILPMPAFAARLAFGEMADELLLGSQKVVSEVLQGTGFQHRFPDLETALRHLLGRPLPGSSVAMGESA